MKKRHRCFGKGSKEIFVIAAVAMHSLLAGNNAVALPTDGMIVAGSATITTSSPATMVIGQESNRAIINWNSFGIGKGEAVTIAQPTAQSTLLNRVIGNDPSSIFGSLSANGRVFLVNPNGMFFASGSKVNAGGFVASTLAINNDDFMAARYAFSNNDAQGVLLQEGAISGDFISLLGTNVTNNGTAIAKKGSVALAGGEAVLLELDASGLVALKVDKSTYNARITNNGILEASDGNVLIMASAANDVLGSVINNSGIVRANSISERDGSIVIEGGSLMNTGSIAATTIRANMNTIVDAGTWNTNHAERNGTITILAEDHIEQTATSVISADGAAGGDIRIDAGEGLYLSGTLRAEGDVGTGGTIAITAPQTVVAGAQISVDGEAGGGTMLIGGGWQGNDATLSNAAETTVTASSQLNANALHEGNGGTIVLWSDQSTTFAGSLEAKGGANSGNGGNVEVSSHENLRMLGHVKLSAPNGANGTLLLDPRNLTIDANASSALFSVIPLPDANPAVGDQYGSGGVVELNNGNILVANPFDDFLATDAGAVRLYKSDGTLLSTLTGSSSNDHVGESVLALTDNNNAVTSTRLWSSNSVTGAGAITWIDGHSGSSGSVSSTNSLVGSSINDGILQNVLSLANGHYVVASPSWDNGTLVDAGATTWGDGLHGMAGVISATNSLVGSKKDDGNAAKVVALTNGNYVISSPLWDNGATNNVGAVTWANGLGGTVGAISVTNSLSGSKTGDNIGLVLTALSNGNYVIGSPNWDNGGVANAGAATWIDGSVETVGSINAANSLIGSKANDKVGTSITALDYGNYVVNSSSWHNNSVIDVGAVTWRDGSMGTTGVVSTTNSLVGSATGDGLYSSIVALSNGNYVIVSPIWDSDTTTDAGAITWGDGAHGTIGTITATNSFIGATAQDGLSATVTALTNGNYIIASPKWDNGTTTDSGAITWGDGTHGSTGVISEGNSLIGSTTNDFATYSIVPLANGNYVVSAAKWDNGTITDTGAVTWGNGNSGTVGTISQLNSLVGSVSTDFMNADNIGSNTITVLTNGHYVVSSPGWNSNTGAVTWGNGIGGTVGEVSAINSLIGGKSGDQIGMTTVALPSGNYVTASSLADNGSIINVGAVTWANGLVALVGEVSSNNSLTGSLKDDKLSSGGITPLRSGSLYGSVIINSKNWLNDTGKVEIFTPYFAENDVLSDTYTSNPGIDNNLTPNQLTTLLNAGSNVVLKANNNITVYAAILASNPEGNGGNLDLHAGQSLLINSNITTDNGNLTLIANDKLDNGVIDAMRLPGSAVITMAPGTTLDVGTGNVVVELRDGEGLTNRESGDITLRDISANSISVHNNGATTASGITLASGTLAASATSGSSIVLMGKDFDNSGQATLLTTDNARWLIYSENPTANNKGGLISNFRHYKATSSNYNPDMVSESGDGFIYQSTAGQLTVDTNVVSGSTTSYYGEQPDAVYGYTLSGFSDNEDNAANIGLTGNMVVTGAPTASSSSGTYTVSYAEGLISSKGFTFTPDNGVNYTVEPQPIVILPDDQDKTYDEQDPPLTWDIESDGNARGLIAGDIFSGELARVTGEEVGSYAILQNTLNNSNYAITFHEGALTINKRPITLSAMAASKIYGEVDPSLAVTLTSGTLGSTTVNDLLYDVTGTLTRQSGANAGSYDIALGSGSKASNYAITFVADNDALAITKRPIIITANNLTKTYGDADPGLTWQAEAANSALPMVAMNNSALASFTPEGGTAPSISQLTTGGFIAVDTIVIPESVEQLFSYSLQGILTHTNPEAVVTLELRSVDGSSLPSWISFDAVEKIISGTPPPEAIGVHQLELVATDQFGAEIHTIVELNIQ